ncbi:MAG TPA: OmpA family protein [Saprospiraceae bacterium]|nr:OmpA family protein [Saprospiraceae bacterium]HMP14129.1 OmpA family protein [Saprospiraceae bacterium]
MKTKIHLKLMHTLLILALVLGSGCKASRTFKGAAIGAAAGGAVGGVIGNKAGNTAAGVIIGAAVGGTAGALIGRYMDKQAEEIRRDLKGAKVERVGEGILITFDSGLLFDVGSYQLRPATRNNLVELAKTLNKYPDTEILVEGHTDNRGAADYNMTLSENRAKSVFNQLVRQGVSSKRFNVVGYGLTQPIADNNTAEGRQLNRRVEIAIFADKKLKKAAKRGDIKVD